MTDIVVVASFVVGLTVRLPRMPFPGESLVGDLFDFGPGGKGTNMAVTAARQGKQVSAVMKIGQDVFGGVATELFQKEHLSTDYVFRTSEEPTAVGLVYLQTSGENTIGVYRGANWTLTPAEVRSIAPEMRRARALLTQLEIPDDSVMEAINMGRQAGLHVILNPAPVRSLCPSILRDVDYLTPNEGEARQLAGIPGDDTSVAIGDVGRRLLALGAKTVIITLGAQGCLVCQPEAEPFLQPACPAQVVDTVGAGDAFNGGLAVALSEGKPLQEAVRWANATAALSTQAIGAISGLPDRAAVESLLAKG